MKKTIAWMLLMGTVALCLFGCREDKQATTREGNVPAGGTVAEGKGTAQLPPGTPAGTPGMTADALSRDYMQEAEKVITGIEQKLQAWRDQADAQIRENPKVQSLNRQVVQQLGAARTALDKMRNATGTELTDAKVAADEALRRAEERLHELQSAAGTQPQVTQEQ